MNKASLNRSSVPNPRKKRQTTVQVVAPNETLSEYDFHNMCLSLAIIAEHIHAQNKERERIQPDTQKPGGETNA